MMPRWWVGPVLHRLQTHQSISRPPPRPGISTWLLVETDPQCYRAADTDMIPSERTGHDPTMPRVTSPATHMKLFLTILESPVLYLSIDPTSFCFFFLFHFFTIYLLLLLALRLSGYLMSSQEWFWSVISNLRSMMLSRVHLQHELLSSGSDWWSYQASSLSGPHGAILLVILCSFLPGARVPGRFLLLTPPTGSPF